MFIADLEEDAEGVWLSIARLYQRRLGILGPERRPGRNCLTDVFSDIVLGFYETDDNKMYIISDKDSFQSERPPYGGARGHSRASAVCSLISVAFLDELEDYDDRRMALRALIEGDALTLGTAVYVDLLR